MSVWGETRFERVNGLCRCVPSSWEQRTRGGEPQHSSGTSHDKWSPWASLGQPSPGVQGKPDHSVSGNKRQSSSSSGFNPMPGGGENGNGPKRVTQLHQEGHAGSLRGPCRVRRAPSNRESRCRWGPSASLQLEAQGIVPAAEQHTVPCFWGRKTWRNPHL